MVEFSSYNWIIEKLKGDKKILKTNIDSDGVLNILRTNGVPLRIKVMPSLDKISLQDINPLAELNNIDFILHTFKEPYIYGSVIELLEKKQKILGGYGDIFRVLRQDFNYPYLPPEVKFVKRGLEQHTKVKEVRRLDDRRYEISRYGLEPVIIVSLNDYDLGIESIRNAISKYKEFDAVLKSNPNGSITTSALKLSDSREIKVFKWGELLGKLNQKWNWKK